MCGYGSEGKTFSCSVSSVQMSSRGGFFRFWTISFFSPSALDIVYIDSDCFESTGQET